jgi:hypothetical protein
MGLFRLLQGRQGLLFLAGPMDLKRRRGRPAGSGGPNPGRLTVACAGGARADPGDMAKKRDFETMRPSIWCGYVHISLDMDESCVLLSISGLTWPGPCHIHPYMERNSLILAI